MTPKFSLYLKCQLAGWLFYGLILVLHAFLIAPPSGFLYTRIITTLLLGFIITHVLRELIIRFGLRPPLTMYKWPFLVMLVSGILVFYASINSVIVEWLHIYPPQSRVSMSKRFIANLILDSPIILVWVCIYYLWHYVELGTAIDKKIADLEKLVRQMKQELGFSDQ